MCDGSDSLHTGAVPKTEHNEGADPKTELKKLNTALLLVCWSVSLLFCRVSYFCGAPCLWVLVWACLPGRVPCCGFPTRRATSPEPIIF